MCVCKCVCMCVSYCFHEWSDVTAFPWFWAAYVTLGLKDIQVQVIDIARWALKCTVQTHVSIQTKLCTHIIQNYQYFFIFYGKVLRTVISTVKKALCVFTYHPLDNIDLNGSLEKQV